ncbi:hypothetical protein GCM10009555_051110 [Acrocarpospora macrocephala]|uniref:RHS repeat protein n=1 Tax=Acrocarpospora macrocephala TaxID=150177 RepID=A0A5M3WZR1_9ACTN|nr:hypothetical protein Amac_079910 [Acrocarpospora macrocephala]
MARRNSASALSFPDPAGLARKTAYSYDANTNITTATRTTTGTARTESLSFEYDSADQPTRSMVENGATDLITTWTYDDCGLVKEVTPPCGNEAGATRIDHTTLLRYDAAGHLVEGEQPSGFDVPAGSLQVDRGVYSELSSSPRSFQTTGRLFRAVLGAMAHGADVESAVHQELEK